MELVARLRHQVPSWLQGRAICHLPDPVSFTEAPETMRILGNQRDRWQRGLADTLWRHRKMAFNRRYGAIGLVVMPFYILFELLGPIIELFGYGYFVLMLVGGVLEPWFATLFFILAMLIGFLLSLGAILLEELSLSFFRERGDMWRLVAVALLENIGYRQVILWYRLRGLWGYVRGRKTWGRMTRLGFGGPSKQKREGRASAAPIAAVALLIAVVSLPVGWLIKPRPPAKVVVLSKTVPFDSRREHKRLMWLFSQAKISPPMSRLLWDSARDYVGYDPSTRRGHLLDDKDLAQANLLYIADTYGVYTDDYDAMPRPIAHLELSKRIYGGLTESDMDVVERFAARGGRIAAEFNTFATPTDGGPRSRMEKMLGVHWSGWAGRRVENFADDLEIAQWVQKRWAEETGKVYDLEGPGILMIHEDGRVVCLQEDVDIPANAMVLHMGEDNVPYTYWFDIVSADVLSNVRAEFTIETTEIGNHLLRKFGIPSRFPAVVHDDAYRRVYVCGDVADGDSALGPPWLAIVPRMRAWMARLNLVPEDVRLLWKIHAPLINRILEAPP